MRTDRQRDLDMYYNDHVKMRIIHRLEQVKTWTELMGIQSAVHDALSREAQNEQQEKAQFELWKKSQETKK